MSSEPESRNRSFIMMTFILKKPNEIFFNGMTSPSITWDRPCKFNSCPRLGHLNSIVKHTYFSLFWFIKHFMCFYIVAEVYFIFDNHEILDCVFWHVDFHFNGLFNIYWTLKIFGALYKYICICTVSTPKGNVIFLTLNMKQKADTLMF